MLVNLIFTAISFCHIGLVWFVTLLMYHGQASCGSVSGASRFLIGLVTCFATQDGIPAVARVACADRRWAAVPSVVLSFLPLLEDVIEKADGVTTTSTGGAPGSRAHWFPAPGQQQDTRDGAEHHGGES